jgi:holliday junction DNA helicase RuvB
MQGKGGGKGSRRDPPADDRSDGRDEARGDGPGEGREDPGWDQDPPADLAGILNPFDPSGFEAVEAQVERTLRPKKLAEFVGQRRVVENLSIAIEAAKARGDILDHVLLSGMPGLGKTTLAYLIAETMGAEIDTTSGPVIERGKDLVGHLTNLRRGAILFIDEIHRMSREAEEYLYSAMEDFRVDIRLDTGPESRSYRVPVQPFTLVGATTREGLLAAPFRNRFGILEKLESYEPEDLAEIILRSAAILQVQIDRDAALVLAERSRGTPRFANRFLRRVRDVAQWKGGPDGPVRVDRKIVDEGLQRLGIDEQGLDLVDRKILRLLVDSGDMPVGVKTLAISIGEEERTIEDVYEPFLIQKGLMVKTPRGRLATHRASEILGVLRPTPP